MIDGKVIIIILAFEKKRLNTVSIVGRSIRLPIVLILHIFLIVSNYKNDDSR